MLSQDLEVCLHLAFMEARQKRHEYLSVEHLLLALLDNPSAAQTLRACGADIEELRRELNKFIAEHTPLVSGSADVDTQPTIGFQRVLQRAILHVQSTGKKEVTGANVLVAIFGEKDSHAVYFLQNRAFRGWMLLITLHMALAKLLKIPNKRSPKEDLGAEESKPRVLENFTINLNESAAAGKIDPLIGREYEVERVIQTLCRRRKITRFWLVKQVLGKQPLLKGWLAESSWGMCLKFLPMPRSILWIWARF